MMDIPLPVQFNCWKHHAEFMKDELSRINIDGFNHLIKEIKIIGDALMDLYLGRINPEKICSMILAQLTPDISKAEYVEWLYKDSRDFRIIEIDDGSRWILRLGEEGERYIHIHPGRYSPLSIRVKAQTLKTAILVCAWKRIYDQEITIAVINDLRKEYLNLSPVKNLSSVPALNRLIEIFIYSDQTDS